MNDSIDPERLRDLLVKTRAELFVTKLVLIDVTSILLANASPTQRDEWLVEFRRMLTNCASAAAADPTQRELARRNAEAIEDQANSLFDLIESAARQRSR